MIKAKITKNIIRKGANVMGITISAFQIVIGLLGVLLAGIELLLMWGKVNTDIMMTIVFFSLAAFIFPAIVKIQGLSLGAFIAACLKGADKRPFCRKEISTDENDEEA